VWIKYWEVWSSGESTHFDYIEYDRTQPTDDRSIRDWLSENEVGKENNWSEHYRGVKYELVDKPDKKWLETKLKDTNERIKYLTGYRNHIEHLLLTE
jgi:hypothetical protein